jgi:uncharacterized membrane protein YgdD (TMEM256/DUF423 family)
MSRAGHVLTVAAAVYGASGVALGALGAHALQEQLGPAGVATWQTATLYHMLHAVALLAIAGGWRGRALPAGFGLAGACFLAGVPMFSGSLYLLSLGGPSWLGPITPLGGVAFIVGWLALLVAGLRGSAAA